MQKAHSTNMHQAVASIWSKSIGGLGSAAADVKYGSHTAADYAFVCTLLVSTSSCSPESAMLTYEVHAQIAAVFTDPDSSKGLSVFVSQLCILGLQESGPSVPLQEHEFARVILCACQPAETASNVKSTDIVTPTNCRPDAPSSYGPSPALPAGSHCD